MKKLLFSITKKDFEIQVFRAGGKGGQKQNKTSSGVIIIHKESGARGEARDSRYQHVNKKNAFKRLINTQEFKQWLKIKAAQISGELAELEKIVNRKVDEQMEDKNLKIEYY